MTEREPTDPGVRSMPDAVVRRHDGDAQRWLEFEIEVAGTPEVVWQAIATGPGISSWYVPHTVEERAGGAASARFGPAPEMEVPGRVAEWDPPNRVVFDGGQDGQGLAFEWTVEARSGDTCIVRLVNRGFGAGGGPWDDYYDGMAGGWLLFLSNLWLHLEHFAGRSGVAALAGARWPGPRQRAWDALIPSMGLPLRPELGQRVSTAAGTGPRLAGTVVQANDWRVALVLDQPAPGTAFVACEGGDDADEVEVSIWSYLYGSEAPDLADRYQKQWSDWLNALAPS